MTNESTYWAEREHAKAAALKMAANLTAREKGLAVAAAKRTLADDVRRDQARQRQFERRFLSLDAPDEEGNAREYSFGSREMNRLYRELDRPYWEHVRELRFRRALYLLREHPELQKTLVAIRRFQRRQTIGINDLRRTIRQWSNFDLATPQTRRAWPSGAWVLRRSAA